MSTKYFVHGGGRWRELELSTGCVSGWGRVQWVSMRCGRLVAARRRRVLHALSALAVGCPTRARDGPRLPIYRELEEPKPVQLQRSIDSHIHCCCGHKHGCKNGVEHHKSVPHLTSLNTTVDAATQADPIISNKVVTEAEIHSNHTRKRKHRDTSSDSNESTTQANRNFQNKIRNCDHQIVRRHSDASSDSVSSLNKKQTNFPTKELIISEEDVNLLRSCIEKNILFPEADLHLFDSSDEYKTLIFYRLNPLVNVERSAQIKRMLHEERESSQDDNVTLDEFVSQLGLRSVKDIRKARRYKTRNTIVRSPKKKDLTTKPLSNRETNNREIASSSSSDDVNLHSLSTDLPNKTSSKSRPNKRKSYQLSSSGSNTETDKENNNSNKKQTKNVKASLHEALRIYRKKNGRFKSTGKRKARNETKSNRNMDKKPKLCSNDDVSESRPRLRDRSVVISSDSDNTPVLNLNNERRESKRLSADKKSLETEKKADKSEKKTEESKKEPLKKQMGLFFKKKRSGSPQKKVVASKIRARPVPRSGGSREYSAAEDAAIVRWLRAEPGRAARVNGNQLWRQLETEYPALAHRDRSWHSLRNRYLRGVLPALHQLPLPAAAAAQLRAAAAQGEIKSRRRSAARHPLFPEPPRGASSRLHTASRSPPASPRPPRRSPRDPASVLEVSKSALKQNVQDSSPTYSEVTRRFALRLRSTPSHTPRSSASKDNSPNKSVRFEDEAAGKGKSRRLYNPN